MAIHFLSHETLYGTANSCGVMIGHLASKKIRVDRIKNGNQGEIFIVNVDIYEDSFALINLYNANTETKQIKHIKKTKHIKKLQYI